MTFEQLLTEHTTLSLYEVGDWNYMDFRGRAFYVQGIANAEENPLCFCRDQWGWTGTSKRESQMAGSDG